MMAQLRRIVIHPAGVGEYQDPLWVRAMPWALGAGAIFIGWLMSYDAVWRFRQRRKKKRKARR